MTLPPGDAEAPESGQPAADGPRLVPASLLLRAGAFAIDALLVSAMALLVATTPPEIFPPDLVPGERAAIYRDAADGIMAAVAFAVPLVYAGFLHGGGGRSPGQRATNLSLLRTDGRVVGFWRAGLRFYAHLVSLLPGGLGFFALLWDHRRRAWHDRLFDTTVLSRAPEPLESGDGRAGRIAGVVAIGLALAVAGTVAALAVLARSAHEPRRVFSTELQPGQCIVQPLSDDEWLRVVPCEGPHHFEVVGVVHHGGGGYDEDAINSSADAGCFDQFAAYVGARLRDTPYSLERVVPSAEEWVDGKKTTACVAWLTDDYDRGTVRGTIPSEPDEPGTGRFI